MRNFRSNTIEMNRHVKMKDISCLSLALTLVLFGCRAIYRPGGPQRNSAAARSK